MMHMITFALVAAAIFTAGTLAGCFILMDWLIPLASNGSRAWLVISLLIAAQLVWKDAEA